MHNVVAWLLVLIATQGPGYKEHRIVLDVFNNGAGQNHACQQARNNLNLAAEGGMEINAALSSVGLVCPPNADCAEVFAEPIIFYGATCEKISELGVSK